jgi:hypothetical protein
VLKQCGVNKLNCVGRLVCADSVCWSQTEFMLREIGIC